MGMSMFTEKQRVLKERAAAGLSAGAGFSAI